MREFAESLLAVATPTSILSTLVFGLMIGAFYGYELESGLPPRYPFQFWLVGLGFVLVLAVLGIAGETAVDPARQVGRAILWTFLCGAIPIGRWIRIKLRRRPPS